MDMNESIEEAPNSLGSAFGELNRLEAGSMQDSTKRTTRYGACTFTEWLDTRGKVCDFAKIQLSRPSYAFKQFLR